MSSNFPLRSGVRREMTMPPYVIILIWILWLSNVNMSTGVPSGIFPNMVLVTCVFATRLMAQRTTVTKNISFEPILLENICPLFWGKHTKWLYFEYCINKQKRQSAAIEVGYYH